MLYMYIHTYNSIYHNTLYCTLTLHTGYDAPNSSEVTRLPGGNKFYAKISKTTTATATATETATATADKNFAASAAAILAKLASNFAKIHDEN